MVISHSALAMKPCKMRSLELFCLDGARKRVAPSDSVWLRAKLASPTRRRARAGGSARRGGAASGAEAEGAEWPEAQRYRAEGAERPEAERDRVEGWSATRWRRRRRSEPCLVGRERSRPRLLRCR
jgi:hypothetical protein